jgi:hypothetical protein
LHINHAPIINFMEPSPSSEAASCSATQAILSILWGPRINYREEFSLYNHRCENLKSHVNYCVRKNPPLMSIPSKTNPAYTPLTRFIYDPSLYIFPSTHSRAGIG